jgi:branched-chain amino acid transport system permease protein
MSAIVGEVLQGILQGGLYALIAIGLSLSIGIVRLVNLAHGDFVILSSYGILAIAAGLGLSPVLALLLVVPLAAAGGYLLQVVAFKRIAGEKILSSLLLTFGMSIVLQNVLLMTSGADSQRISLVSIETAAFSFGAVSVGALPVMTFAVAILLVGSLDLLLYRTDLGARIRAVAEDVSAAGLVGLPTGRINAITMAIIGGTVAIAAFFVGVQTNFDPSSGPTLLLSAFEAVILGGLGSVWGTPAGGIILGVAQAVAAAIDVNAQVLAGHLVFLCVMLMRPQGMFSGRAA